MQAAALELTKSIRRQIVEDTGGDSRLSGVGKKGAKVGAGFDVKGRLNPVAIIRARGPLHLLERPTKPHPIGPKARRAARGGRVGVKFPDGSVRRGPVQHPGTRGKHTFAKGVRAGRGKALRILRSSLVSAVKRGLRA